MVLSKIKNLFQFIDFDTTGQKLTKLMGLWRDLKKMIYLNVIGITHYLGEDDGEWLITNEGKNCLKLLMKKMIVSISCKPKHSKNIEKLAEIFSKMPAHHMGGMKSNINDKSENNNILKLSKFKNIYF